MTIRLIDFDFYGSSTLYGFSLSASPTPFLHSCVRLSSTRKQPDGPTHACVHTDQMENQCQLLGSLFLNCEFPDILTSFLQICIDRLVQSTSDFLKKTIPCHFLTVPTSPTNYQYSYAHITPTSIIFFQILSIVYLHHHSLTFQRLQGDGGSGRISRLFQYCSMPTRLYR